MSLRMWLGAAAVALVLGGGLVIPTAPASQATVCGSVGGRHVDVSGCADPLYEVNDVLAPPPPPPPPPAYVPAPPPNISVFANVGRRISISGCV